MLCLSISDLNQDIMKEKSESKMAANELTKFIGSL